MLAARGLVLGILLASLSALAVALECLGHASAVTTYPAGDIAVKYGNPLEIYCVVEPPYTSSQLKFQRLDDNVKYETQIVNQTTARLYIERPERQMSTFECVLETGGTKLPSGKACSNRVVVDTAPENVTEFQCRSYNLERLECKWRAPTHYVKTDYSLTFKMYTLQSNSCAVRYIGGMYSCVFGGNSTDPPYRAQEGVYNFTLSSLNRFGIIKQLFVVDHYAVLIPNKPFNLLKNNLTTHSLLLQWQIPRDIADFSPGVDHKVKYQIKTVDNLTTWRLADVSTLRNINKTTYRYWLRGLPYAHWSYDVRIFIKSILAPDEDEFWSQFEATTFTTPSERPPRPPRTELGAFESQSRRDSRDVCIYWQLMDEYEESGENFTYNVVVHDGARAQTLRSNKSSYIHFSASLHAVNVSIASSNNYGSSEHKSYIYVPAQADILPEPTSFTKTVFGNKTYDLRWQPPKHTLFDSYTLFWCSNTDTDVCNGKLNFSKLNHYETSYRIVVSEDDKTYMFAISANRGELSSGMVWGTCTLPAENATNKVRDFKRGPNLGRRSVELQWVLGCSFSEGHVKGYNVTYCPRADNTFHCSDTEKRFFIIDDPLQNNVNITGLMPHSTYSFHIAVIYNDGTGYSSNGVDATTLEDKPSEPLNFNISNVTAHSMLVSWDPPALKNGILLEYLVSYRINEDPHTSETRKLPVPVADKSTQLKDERQELNLTELQAFTNYTVLVQACTTDCSVAVVAGQVRTAIGSPGPIPEPSLNDSSYLLYWEPPAVPGGTLDLYQINITSNDPLFHNQIINRTTLGGLKVPQCDAVERKGSWLSYSVRALNYDADKYHGVMRISGNVSTSEAEESWDGTVYEGPWSQPRSVNCGQVSSSTADWILWIIAIGAVLFIVMVALGSRKIWIRFKFMSALDPELPPGLGPSDEKETKYALGGDWSSPVKKSEEKSFPAGTGDEVLLLPPSRRTADNKDFSGSSDSTDSTTLSLNSKETREGHVITSDDASDDSSLHITSHTPAPADPAPPPPRVSTGYKTFATQPAMPDYQENTIDDDDSICSDDLSDAPLPSGYVQTATLPAAAAAPRFDIPSGYVRAQDATVQPQVPPANVSFPLPTSIPKPMLPVNPSMPKFLPMEWKLAPESVVTRNLGAEVGGACKAAPARAPTRPSGGGGYVSHADAVINKHLNIISNSQLGEEPALPDPNMSPEAYCRFAWNADPGADDNLRTLLRGEGAPTEPALVLQAPKD